MAKVTLDVIEGHTITEDTGEVVVVRIVEVQGLEGDADVRAFNALQESEVPQFGDPHPSIPVIRVGSRVVTAIDTNNVSIEINYRELTAAELLPDDLQPPILELLTSVQQVTTSRDKDGKEIKVSITFDDERDTVEGGAEVNISVPQTVVRFTRREIFNPLSKAIANVGKINSGGFLGSKAKTWLCTNLSGTTNNGGQSYLVTYEFQLSLRKDSEGKLIGWDTTVAFIDEKTGKPVVQDKGAKNPIHEEEITEGDGLATVEVYETINFNSLNLGLG